MPLNASMGFADARDDRELEDLLARARAALPPATGVLHARLAAAYAALDAFEAALAHPLAEIAEPAHRAYLAALVLACTLAEAPAAPLALRRTTARLLELFERFASPADRALRERLEAAESRRNSMRSNIEPTRRVSGR